MKEFSYSLVVLAVAIAFFVGVLWAMVWGYQYFKVFSAEQSGRAEYVQAEQNRQITILEAEAENMAATSKAEAKIKIATAEATAEIERAKGVSESNKIIGDSLKGKEEYLRYLYIQGLQTNQMQTVYVPTEAGLPILEAGKR